MTVQLRQRPSLGGYRKNAPLLCLRLLGGRRLRMPTSGKLREPRGQGGRPLVRSVAGGAEKGLLAFEARVRWKGGPADLRQRAPARLTVPLSQITIAVGRAGDQDIQ